MYYSRILCGNNADPTILEEGGKYYMTVSSFRRLGARPLQDRQPLFYLFPDGRTESRRLYGRPVREMGRSRRDRRARAHRPRLYPRPGDGQGLAVLQQRLCGAPGGGRTVAGGRAARRVPRLEISRRMDHGGRELRRPQALFPERLVLSHRRRRGHGGAAHFAHGGHDAFAEAGRRLGIQPL